MPPLGTAAIEPFLNHFLSTMPERYRMEVDPATAREHAHIVQARRGALVHTGLFGEHTKHAGLCVVAMDTTGLLAAISASLMLEGFDITRAEAYTRETASGSAEAVDLFWVHRADNQADSELTQRDALAVSSTLTELLHDERSPLGNRSFAAPKTTPGSAETHIRFSSTPETGSLTLEIETNNRSGLLLAVTAALAEEKAQIIGSRVQTRGLRVHDRFELLEADGSPLDGVRLQRIQLAVLVAVDGPPGHQGATD